MKKGSGMKSRGRYKCSRYSSLLISSRKSQITTFIIIAIVLLFSVALALYIRSYIVKAELPGVEETKVPRELEPIKDYIKNCIRKEGINALEILGGSGGYIHPEDYEIETIESDPTHHLSKGVKFSTIVPYWKYMASPNGCKTNCMFASLMPPLTRDQGDYSIENQLDDYINDNLRTCAERGFVEFRKQGFIIEETGDIETLTTVTKNTVTFQVTYPLIVRRDARSTQGTAISNYFVEVDVPLQRIYTLAAVINYISSDENLSFIDHQTLNWISAAAGAGDIPPLTKLSFDASDIKFYTINQVEEALQERIINNMQNIRLPNTRNYADLTLESDSELVRGIYSTFEQDVLATDDFKDLAVDFIYLGWPMFISITPSTGGVIGPEISSSDAFGAGAYTFVDDRHWYDLSYPVVVRIHDPNINVGELSEKGYYFQFAVEACIVSNQPCRTGTGFLPRFTLANSLFCDIKQRLSGNITIETVDKVTKAPLENVMISYKCGSAECFIGQTKLDPEINKSVLVSTFPICEGGLLNLRRDNYQKFSVALDTKVGEDAYLMVSG